MSWQSTGLEGTEGTSTPWRVEVEETGEVVSHHQRPDKAWERASKESAARGGVSMRVVGEHRVVATVTEEPVTEEPEPDEPAPDTEAPPDPGQPQVVVGTDDVTFSTTAGDDSVVSYAWRGGLDAGGGEWGPTTTTVPEHTIPKPADGNYFVCVSNSDEAGNASGEACTSFTVATEDTTEPEPEPTGDHPHEPSGFTKLTERGFDATVENGWTWSQNCSGCGGIVSETSAPRSPSNVGEAAFLTDGSWSGGGTGPVNTRFGFSSGVSEVYVHLWIRLENPTTGNWDGHSSNVNKVFFHFGSDGDEKLVWNLNGTDPKPSMGHRITAQGNYAQNLTTRSLMVGEWHEVEFHFVHNTPGVADGQVHGWVDGTKVYELYDVVFSKSGETGDFADIRWNPTYGGNGGELPETDQFMWMDHIYVSAK